jgi:hypothetical protein
MQPGNKPVCKGGHQWVEVGSRCIKEDHMFPNPAHSGGCYEPDTIVEEVEVTYTTFECAVCGERREWSNLWPALK